MEKNLYIAEKPSVAKEFAKALGESMKQNQGYLESEHHVVTWCVGHLVTMSYPDAYDERLKRWDLATLPFLPPGDQFRYEVIAGVKQQFKIVEKLLNREDITTIYVCTDSGREGEYIYRLVEQEAHLQGKCRKRVWIDSQTEEEILRGIREAKDLSAYDNLSDAAYLRAKEDFLMGINFSRLLTLKYGPMVKNALSMDRAVISVGRVMTCVLGLVVKREREIREFVKTPFYRVFATLTLEDTSIQCEWKAVEGSKYFGTPALYKENGFLKKADAEALIEALKPHDVMGVAKIEKKKEKKNPPMLYNLAELQNDCARLFKISPDETLKIAQELYEKKLTTYPRTDARVLSTAVAKEIHKNLQGLCSYGFLGQFAKAILSHEAHKKIASTKYVNDKLITDHYAIIPTGQGLGQVSKLSPTTAKVYHLICERFLAIFYPAAEYEKLSVTLDKNGECFFASYKALVKPGYLVIRQSQTKKPDNGSGADHASNNAPARATTDSAMTQMHVGGESPEKGSDTDEQALDENLAEKLLALKKGMELPIANFEIKEGETSPPKRYNSGSLILAMENAGQLIEEEELREQLKGSGIGTSATRAEILKKLVNNKYLALNKKTQIITPTCFGESIYEVVRHSVSRMLDPIFTASWELGLSRVAEGTVTEKEYMDKLKNYIVGVTNGVKQSNMQASLRQSLAYVKGCYQKGGRK